MKKFLVTGSLIIFSLCLGLGIYFFAPISSMVLEQFDFKGKLTLEDAEAAVQTAGYTPLYSWYVVEDFTPEIVVMSMVNGTEEKIPVHAFKGTILKENLDSVTTTAVLQKNVVSPNNTTELDDELFAKIVERFPVFEVSAVENKKEWGEELTYVYLWVDEHYIQISFDAKTKELVEINERFWQKKDNNGTTDFEPPVISITYPVDGAIFPHDTASIEVLADVTDNTDPNPIIEGTGTFQLVDGLNIIIVAASDSAGNASSEFVIIERE